MIRITGGLLCGRQIISPSDIRPSSGRTREYIFSQLAHICPGAKTLDLFAGSGALGIEAVSRGADSIIFVDKSKKSMKAVKSNLEKLDIKGRFILKDAFNFLNTFNDSLFTLILADPPYDTEMPGRLLSAMEESAALAEGGYFVMEISSRIKTPSCTKLYQLSMKKMGDTCVGIWINREPV